MPLWNKLTYEKVKKSFSQEGYELLSKKYTNAQINLKYRCHNGHISKIPWSNWSRGIRCAYCSGNKKLDINFVRQKFAEEGYELLSNEYKNSLTGLRYKCPLGHIGKMSYSNFYQGKRCPICSLIGRTGEFHYNWKGGIGCEPYCDAWADKDFKKSIFRRDNYECQNPDCWKTSSKLTVHHVDYNKQNCSPPNLLTLCRSCNARANYNRPKWEKLYVDLMKEGELC